MSSGVAYIKLTLDVGGLLLLVVASWLWGGGWTGCHCCDSALSVVVVV